MAGGFRPGAGRPRKSEGLAKAAAKKAGLSPLDYMLQVMRDDSVDMARRDRMAIAAAPYVHGRVSEMTKGKKDQASEAAKGAGTDTGWGSDLISTVN